MPRYLLALLLIGCSEFELKSNNDGDDEGAGGAGPEIEVDREMIDFGEVEVASGAMMTEIVSVTNTGTADLQIGSIGIENDQLHVYSNTAISSIVLPPGAVGQFTVSYKPVTAGEDESMVIIESNDADEPTTEVGLVGTGLAPVVDVDPMNYDFGSVYIGCEPEQTIRISNIGNMELIVDGLEFYTGSEDFEFNQRVEDNGALNWTLPPGESKDVEVVYKPLDEYSEKAFLYVYSNDPFKPEVLAMQEGMGNLYGENTDVFEQPIQAKTVILFAVDKSCSMDEDLANVQANFNAYTSTLESLNADFRVAAIVPDSGEICGDVPYIDQDNAEDGVEIMEDMLGFDAPCQVGNNTERAFALLEAALSANQEWITNEDGWDESKLNLIGVSDEIEQSPGTWLSYVEEFQGLREDPDDVVFHAIGGDYPTGCNGNEPYTGYFEAVSYTGGEFLSICATDWGAQLQQLAEASADDLSTFDLTEWPVPDTIVVSVDGVSQTADRWDYIDAENAVHFEEDYIPAGGAIIEINYALMPNCNF